MTIFATNKDFTPEEMPAHVHTKDCWMTGDQKCIAWRITTLESNNAHLVANLGRIRTRMREMKGVLDRIDAMLASELKK